ncbi:MAG: SUF system NifU family Fe-S cluster assembly protein [Chloroflexi bacterium CFX7]|nr:SUF system NifU family Fe-S cluster assembly protein [Chloroflexi bacterium CFX7]
MPCTKPPGFSPVPIPEPQFDDLYRELLLDHMRHPRNRGTLEHPTHRLEGVNPVCGDEVHLDVAVGDSVIRDIAFSGLGCSISQSSASMLTENVKGRELQDVARMRDHFQAMLVEGAEPDRDLGDLEAFQGVAKFPVRVKCAMLPWKVLGEVIEGADSVPQGDMH